MVFLALSRRLGRTGSRWTGAVANPSRTSPTAAVNRCFHFASQDYAACFQTLPEPDTASLRAAALDYLDTFDPEKWHKEPVGTRSLSNETKHVDP
jgi:hypothetical protein